jgi:uncharacterized membrane-anchored protein YjiN (DUF445 family)
MASESEIKLMLIERFDKTANSVTPRLTELRRHDYFLTMLLSGLITRRNFAVYRQRVTAVMISMLEDGRARSKMHRAGDEFVLKSDIHSAMLNAFRRLLQPLQTN